MKLTEDEVMKLKAAGFDDAHIEEIGGMKPTATDRGIDWANLIKTIIQNGPQLYQFIKTLIGLFGTSAPGLPTDGGQTIPPK